MNREDIIRMARDVGFSNGEIDTCQLMFERFAALVASAEREACAKVAESIAKDMTDLAQWGATQCANSIRKRGQA